MQVELGEECDDSNTVPEDGCSDFCQAGYCGDGVLKMGRGEDGSSTVELSFEGPNFNALERSDPREPPGEGAFDAAAQSNW